MGVHRPPCEALQRDVDDFFKVKSELFSAKDVDAIAELLLTEDSMIISDGQLPVIGRDSK